MFRCFGSGKDWILFDHSLKINSFGSVNVAFGCQEPTILIQLVGEAMIDIAVMALILADNND
jgi:hypothetical protein